MFETGTDRARKAMQLANQEAMRFNHEYIGTEHILLGLVKEGSGVGCQVLRSFEIDLRKVRLEVDKLVASGPDRVIMGKLPQSPAAKKVIEYAMAESHCLGHNYTGTEHMLLGLLREQEGVAAKVLINLGLALDTVREKVLAILGRGRPDSAFVPRIEKLDLPSIDEEAGTAVDFREKRGPAERAIGSLMQGVFRTVGCSDPADIQILCARLRDGEFRQRLVDVVREVWDGIRLQGSPARVVGYLLQSANVVAADMQHKAVGPLHWLLVMLREKSSICAQVLGGFEISADRLTAYMRRTLPEVATFQGELIAFEVLVVYGNLTLSERWLSRKPINDGDVLEALLCVKDGEVVKFLREMHVSPNDVKEKLARVQSEKI